MAKHGQISQDRRRLVAAIGCGIGGSLFSGTASAQTDLSSEQLVFEDQRSDGSTVVISRVSVDSTRNLHVLDSDGSLRNKPSRIHAGEVIEDLEVSLVDPLRETQVVTVRLVGEGSDIGDSAIVTVGEDGGQNAGIPDPILVEAAPDRGFNYPYYLYAPLKRADADPEPLLVQPNNTGSPTDDFDRHRHAARSRMSDGGGRYISDELTVPLLMPVFPRPRREPVDASHYVHALDVTTLEIDGGPLERVDRQLVRMVRDAQRRLDARSYPVREKIMLNGFSAGGTFVNRFAALHPDLVISVTAGGVNGMPLLPVAEARGQTLPYHIGIADLEEITGEPFDREAFRTVNQFLYIGELGGHDTIPYTDAWTNRDRAQLALDVYGTDIADERMRFSRQVYDDVGCPTVFRIYPEKGHNPRPAYDHLVEFHRLSMAGESIDRFRATVDNVPHLHAAIRHVPETPGVGEQVAFDATTSSVRGRELVDFAWSFSDGRTATGALVSHTFETPGGHNMRLTVTDDAGETYESVEQLHVGNGSGGSGGGGSDAARTTTAGTGGGATTDRSTTAGTGGGADTDRSTTSGSGPGFGIVGTLAGLGTGVAMGLRRALRDEG